MNLKMTPKWGWPGHVTKYRNFGTTIITGKTSKVYYRYINNNKTANIKGKNQKFTMTCKVNYMYITQLKLQKKIKKVILHCTTLTYWHCVAE